MRVVDDFGGNDERSMRADDTSAFNCRLIPGTGIWSQHAYGLAVDINPLQNPEVQGRQGGPTRRSGVGGPVPAEPGDDQARGRGLARSCPAARGDVDAIIWLAAAS